jgi:hypothetical protein
MAAQKINQFSMKFQLVQPNSVSHSFEKVHSSTATAWSSYSKRKEEENKTPPQNQIHGNSTPLTGEALTYYCTFLVSATVCFQDLSQHFLHPPGFQSPSPAAAQDLPVPAPAPLDTSQDLLPLLQD